MQDLEPGQALRQRRRLGGVVPADGARARHGLSPVRCVSLLTLDESVAKCNYVAVSIADWDRDNCAVGNTMAVIGERWTLLVLREAFLGVRRFEQLQRNTGVARNILSDRLNTLVAHGILRREAYQERPVRYEYRLTANGLDLYPILITLMAWGLRHAMEATERDAPRRTRAAARPACLTSPAPTVASMSRHATCGRCPARARRCARRPSVSSRSRGTLRRCRALLLARLRLSRPTATLGRGPWPPRISCSKSSRSACSRSTILSSSPRSSQTPRQLGHASTWTPLRSIRRSAVPSVGQRSSLMVREQASGRRRSPACPSGSPRP